MSSKLLDAGATTLAAPWLVSGAAAAEPVAMAFGPAAGGGAEGSPAPRPDDPALHWECRRRVEGLEREALDLASQGQEAKRAAYQQGLEAGAAQESAKWSDALQRAARAIADLSAIKPALRAQVEEDAVRLSLAIARKILRREATVDPSSIAGLLRVALEKASARDILSVRAAPQDAAELSSRLSGLGLPTHVEVRADPTLERGSLLVETSQGHIDASMETQLLEIERGLADALTRSS